MIDRPTYREWLWGFKDRPVVKVLAGVRRSGKSTVMFQFQDALRQNGVREDQIQAYNFESYSINDLRDPKALHDMIVDKAVSSDMNYIFLDEIQLVDGFERVIDSLFIQPNFDVYVTGSNAYLLSGELATLLSGRYVQKEVYPLSFKEYVSAFDNVDSESLFARYIERGGLPLSLSFEKESQYLDYITGVVNTVLVRDILARNHRSDAMLVEELASFLVDSAGSLISIKKISDTLTSCGQKTTSDTVTRYLSSFLEAFLFYRVDRYDLAGKKFLSVNAKYYPVDSAFRRVLVGNRRPNLGHRLEGVVFLELKRRGYEVYIGKIGTLEVDFVAQKDGQKIYIQVSQTIQEEATYQREVASLKAITDSYPKILLTTDGGNYNDNGIQIRNVVEWLLATD
jgi:predicted AAA+ superfamily ATPase